MWGGVEEMRWGLTIADDCTCHEVNLGGILVIPLEQYKKEQCLTSHPQQVHHSQVLQEGREDATESPHTGKMTGQRGEDKDDVETCQVDGVDGNEKLPTFTKGPEDVCVGRLQIYLQ